jgi:DNA-binding CsgD family transcriptional regulator
VLYCAALGQSLASVIPARAAISGRLGISVRTAQTHLARCYAKLGITRRTELASALAGVARG